jgi:GxxExxY protein
LNREDHKEHEGHKGIEDLARAVVDAGLAVHRVLGPGLLESAYEHCFAYELHARGISCQRQVALPIFYRETRLDVGYRLDLVVENAIVIEIKSVEALTRLHESQTLTYLKLSGHRMAFLINFNVVLFKQGLRRLVL